MCTRRKPISASCCRRCAAVPSPRTNIDPHRLQQCLTALVDSALLHSDGPVTLAASTGPAACRWPPSPAEVRIFSCCWGWAEP